MNALSAYSFSVRRRRDGLRKALSMFKEKWICDHLLGKAPTTDAAIILSPLQQLHSISFDNDITFDPIHHERLEGNIGSLMSSENVMVPAYSKDGFNLGFSLSETAGLSSNNFVECNHGAAVRNFVFREDSGTYLAVTRHLHMELVLLFSTSEERRELCFSCFAFPGNSFSTLIEQGVRDPIDFERVLYANMFMKYVRQCPHCGASLGASCDCDLRVSSSKTPLDLNAITKNISLTHLGSGVGSGFFEVFANGVPKVTIAVNSNNKSCCVRKRGRAKRFVDRAVADLLKNTPVEVQRGLASPLTDDVVCDKGLPNSASARKHVEKEIPSSADANTESVTLVGCQRSVGLSYPSLQSPSQAIEDHTIAQPAVSETGLTMDGNSPTSAADFRMTAQTTSAPLFLPTTSRIVAHLEPSMRQPIVPGNAVQAVPHFPDRPPKPDEASVKKMAEDVRTWRAYHRKIRSRESARRSNLIRKQRLEHARSNQRDVTGDVPG